MATTAKQCRRNIFRFIPCNAVQMHRLWVKYTFQCACSVLESLSCLYCHSISLHFRLLCSCSFFILSPMLPLFYFMLVLEPVPVRFSICDFGFASVSIILCIYFFSALVFVIFFIINVILGIFSWQSDCYYYSDVFSIFLIFPLAFFYTPFVLFEPLSYECALAWAEL